jgi:hypothetical protein
MKHIITLAFFALIVLTSCDVVDAPFEKNPVVPVDTVLKDTSTVVVRTGGLQNVLLEDYTGHTCVNCPAAADVAKSIYEKNQPRVVVVGVHAGPFAKPEAPDYPLDHRTDVGEALDALFRISRVGNPNGLVNRSRYNTRFVLGAANWEPATNALLSQQPKLDLALSHTYYPDKRTIIATVDAAYLQPGENDYSLCVWITEDSIVGDQADNRRNPSHVKDYVFEHMLRASMNGTFGDSLTSEIMPIGSSVKKTVRFTIPETATWRLDKCELVAFVIRRKDDQTREVLQVVKQKLKP